MRLLEIRLYFVFLMIAAAISGLINNQTKEIFIMSYTVQSIGQALTQQQVLQYYNTIGNITYDELKTQTMALYGMDQTMFECWLGWIVRESYARSNGAYEGYLTQCTAVNLYQVYSDHTATDFCWILSGYGSDPSYTVSYMQSFAYLAQNDQVSYQPDLRCAYLAMANPDQRCFSCYGGGTGTLIYSFIDGWNGNTIDVREDPSGVRTYPIIQNGGVFGGSGTISFTERTSSPAGSYNPCYMTNLYGASWTDHWNTCIYGDYHGSPVAGADVLANCTGYAQGRALEIYNECMSYNPAQTQTHPFVGLNGNAREWYPLAPSLGLSVSTDPAPGAIICWTEGTDPDSVFGHVGVVESVEDQNTIITTESGYGAIAGQDWISQTRILSGGNWLGNLATMGGYTFQGFILNPASPGPPVPPTPTPGKSKSKIIYQRNWNNHTFRRLLG